MPFDPYYTWLGIPPQDQPPHHYRLLGLQLYEPNDEVIDNAADRQMAHVRSFQTGPHAADSQRLLTAIAMARVTLLDPERRIAYDTQLRQALRPPSVELPLPTYFPTPAYGPAVAPQQPYYPPPQVPSPTPPTPVAVPVPIVSATPTAAASVEASLFTSNSSRSSLATRRRRSRSTTAETIKVVVGGLAGLAIGGAVLWYGLGVHPLGGNKAPTHDDGPKTAGTTGDRTPGGSPKTATHLGTATSHEPRESSPAKSPQLVKAQGNGGTKLGAESSLAKLTLEYCRPENGMPPSQMRAELRLVNQGQNSVDLEQLTLRYWHKGTEPSPRFWCDSSSLGAGRVTYRFIKLNQPLETADGFCEIGFLAAAGKMEAGPRGIELTIRLTSADNSPLDSSRDHSAMPTSKSASFRPTDRITIYQNGKLIGGKEPAGLVGQIDISGGHQVEVARPFPDDPRTALNPRRSRPRIAVPAEELLAQALAEVDRIFRPSDKRSRSDRVELARRLLTTALDADDRPAEQYVLLKRGAELAQTCGEADLVVELVDRLGERFEIDAPLMRQKFLLKTMDAISDEARLKQAVFAARETIYELILGDHYDEALRLADRGVDLCRESIGKSQRKFVTDGRNSLRALHLQWQDSVKARAALDEKPDDPLANFAVGRWLCLQIDDWDSGLRHLARGSDKRLAEAAQADTAADRTLEAQQSVADQWYELSQTSPAYSGYAARALHWYEQGAGKVSGLARAKNEQRITELREQVADYDKTTFARRALRATRPKAKSL